MEALVLASGSSGNAVLVRSGETALLVDAGISALQVRRRLEVFGCRADDITAVLLTHEHSDHVRGLDVLARRHRLPVWATAGTWSAMAVACASGGDLASGRKVAFGSLTVTPIDTSHDAREPVALLIEDGRHLLGLCTDTGIITALLEQRLQGCDPIAGGCTRRRQSSPSFAGKPPCWFSIWSGFHPAGSCRWCG